MSSNSISQHERHGVWVPASAGTTWCSYHDRHSPLAVPPKADVNQLLERRKHRVGDVGSTVPAADFHRLFAVGITLVDRALDPLAGFGCRFESMLVGKPVQHHRGRKYHGRRIGLALPHDVRRGAMADRK